jgi:hypothetical protein
VTAAAGLGAWIAIVDLSLSSYNLAATRAIKSWACRGGEGRLKQEYFKRV